MIPELPETLDIPLALERLRSTGRITPSDDWGPCANSSNTYDQFAAGWRGTSPVPTQAEIETAWQEVVAARPAKEETQKRKGAADLLRRPEINTLVNAIIHELYPLVGRLAKKAGEPIRSEKQFKAAIAARIAAGDVSDPV